MNAQRRWQGQVDAPLSSRGHGQARALAAALAEAPVHAIYSSDLARARQTAEALGEAKGLAVALLPALREMDVGDWGGRAHDEIQRRWPDDFARIRAGDIDVRPGGGETRREVAVRVRRALAEIVLAQPGRRVAIVTHGGVARSLVPHLRLGNTGRVWLESESLSLAEAPDGAGQAPTGGGA